MVQAALHGAGCLAWCRLRCMLRCMLDIMEAALHDAGRLRLYCMPLQWTLNSLGPEICMPRWLFGSVGV